ncbi:PspC domain-containing protein [Qipengyuania marisflavi]|uniref:PspC domain-containing protein n=1 Tax=Qipengyuania marisflavi TaxID=2486356 RepID=A0A5S3PFM5_9SPHN|nr:PspC domain-containing protein [Qipengyuania marisflavi]TMM50390.1 PspC domain-containing protein [Qipengyuania marisflavi]
MSDLKFRDEPAVRPAKSFSLDRRNAKALGVCSGIARHYGIDATLVRIGFVLGTILGFGSFVLIYLAIALIAD